MAKTSKENLTVREILGELAGYASMCWSKTPKGRFESDKASKASDQALSSLREIVLGCVPIRINDKGQDNYTKGCVFGTNTTIDYIRAKLEEVLR